MNYELWGTPDRTSLSFTDANTIELYKQQGVIEVDAEFIWSVEASSWHEAMTLYHEFMGWEPYIRTDE